jgi:hypothetical protein
MKVDHFLKVWSFQSPKIIISPKSVEPKSFTTQIPAAPPVYANSQLKFFSKQKFSENFESLESLHRNLSEK